MGFAFAPYCYETATDALAAFQKSFPSFGDVNYVGHVASSIDAGGTLTYSLQALEIASNTLSSRTGTFTLASCSPADAPVTSVDPVDVLFVLTWGAGVILAIWALGAAIGAAKDVIKKL
jgi:hypothetical protein